jgi:hypothetical protein
MLALLLQVTHFCCVFLLKLLGCCVLLLLLLLLQVTTFSLFRLMREVDGDLTEDQLSTYTSPAAAAAATNSNNSSNISRSTDSTPEGAQELLLLQYVRHGAFGKLCDVMASVQDGSAHELAFSMLLSLALVPEAQRLVADRNEVQCIVEVGVWLVVSVPCS